jgi:hypothetical protein
MLEQSWCNTVRGEEATDCLFTVQCQDSRDAQSILAFFPLLSVYFHLVISEIVLSTMIHGVYIYTYTVLHAYIFLCTMLHGCIFLHMLLNFAHYQYPKIMYLWHLFCHMSWSKINNINEGGRN